MYFVRFLETKRCTNARNYAFDVPSCECSEFVTKTTGVPKANRNYGKVTSQGGTKSWNPIPRVRIRKSRILLPPQQNRPQSRLDSSWQTMPIAAIKKQRISWSRSAENSSRRRSKGDVVMLRIGLKRCPYCWSLEVYRSQPTTWLDRACVLFLLQLAKGVCAVTSVRSSSPRQNAPVDPRRKSARTRANDEKWERSA
jgi:hypothetical protein